MQAKAENPATYAFTRTPIANCRRNCYSISAEESADHKTERSNLIQERPRAGNAKLRVSVRTHDLMQAIQTIAPDETLPFSRKLFNQRCMKKNATKLVPPAFIDVNRGARVSMKIGIAKGG
jgi:hypothetical protein